MSGSSTTTQTVTPEERAYQASQTALAQKQLDILNYQSSFQQDYLNSIKPLLDQQLAAAQDPVQQEIAARSNALQLQQLQDQADLAPLQKQLAQKQLEDAQRGYAATPEQVAQINAATQAAQQSGESDINAFQQNSERQLAQNLAPSLGLRPTDTPIVDRGQLVAQEAQRQQGQLTSTLAQAKADAQLNYPLNAAGVSNAASQFQQSLNLSRNSFTADLANAAANNRMALIGQGMQGGIGLAGAGRGNPISFSRNTTTSTSPGFADILGGLGGLGTGLGAVGVLF